MGIDEASNMEDGYEIILKVAIPEAESRKESEKYILLTEESQTIGEAVNIMKGRISNELDFGHMKMIVLGSDIMKRDLSKVMDWFTRRRDIQQIAYVGVGKPDAKTILDVTPKIERLPSNSLFLFFGETGTESAYVTTSYLFNFRRDLKERGIDAYLPVIEPNDTGGLSIAKLMISSKEKILLELNEEETKMFNILNKGYDKFNVVVETDETNYFVLTMDQVDSSYTFTNRAQPVITFTINFSSLVEESTFEFNKSKMEKYKKLAEETVQKSAKQLLLKLQENNLDPFGFGVHYRSIQKGSEEEKIKQWDALYPNVSFKIDVKATIKGTGVVE